MMAVRSSPMKSKLFSQENWIVVTKCCFTLVNAVYFSLTLANAVYVSLNLVNAVYVSLTLANAVYVSLTLANAVYVSLTLANAVYVILTLANEVAFADLFPDKHIKNRKLNHYPQYFYPFSLS